MVASPGYLARHGAPKSAASLESHSAILYSYRETDWRFTGPGRRDDIVIRPRKCLRINNGLMIRDAAIAGLGIALLPTFLSHAEIKSGALRIVDVGMQAQNSEIFLAYPADRGPSAKIRVLTEHLRQSFGEPPYWEAGLKAPPRKVAARKPAGKQRRS